MPVPQRLGRTACRGSGRLLDKSVLITGGDSGIGRAVAPAYARDGVDFLISYLKEHADADETRRFAEFAGRKCIVAPGDVSDSGHCRRANAVAPGPI